MFIPTVDSDTEWEFIQVLINDLNLKVKTKQKSLDINLEISV